MDARGAHSKLGPDDRVLLYSLYFFGLLCLRPSLLPPTLRDELVHRAPVHMASLHRVSSSPQHVVFSLTRVNGKFALTRCDLMQGMFNVRYMTNAETFGHCIMQLLLLHTLGSNGSVVVGGSERILIRGSSGQGIPERSN